MNSRIRLLVLFLVLGVASGAYFYFSPAAGINAPNINAAAASVDKSASLKLEEELKANIRHYFEGVTLEPKENDLNHAIQLDHSVGRPQMAQGKHKEAFRTYQKVLAISYRQGNLMGVGIGLNVLASLLERMNDKPEALRAALLAYKVAKVMNNKEEYGVAELQLARLLKDTDLAASMTLLARAKESLKGTRYKEDYTRLLPDLASGLSKIGKREQADALYAEAWESAQALGNAPTQKFAKWEVALHYGDSLMDKKEYEKAIGTLEKARSFFSEAEKEGENYTSILHRLARAHAHTKDKAQAKRYFLSAYATYEKTRAAALGEKSLAKLDKSAKHLVDELVDFHISAKEYSSALALLESNKARTLDDIFGDPAYQDANKQWKEMERRHAKEVTALLEPKSDELEILQAANQKDVSLQLLSLLKKQLDERGKLQTELNLRGVAATKTLTGEHIDALQRKLPSDIAIVSFFMAAETASVFVISQSGLRHVPLPMKTPDYRRKIKELRAALTNPHVDFYREPARWLFDNLLQPAVRALPASVKILVYSPDGLLSGIPLEALMNSERFVGDTYAVYRVPSLRSLGSTAEIKAAPAPTGIVCADPEIRQARLPFQQETGQALAKLHPKQVTMLIGKECSESKLVGAIKQLEAPAFLHVGAHGVFYPESAMDSSIWLSGDSEQSADGAAWTAKAMATIDMTRVDLVTLSSCETALTDPKTERDIFGIARALFYGGAKKIVAPLWAVHDQASAEFMQAFHRAYAANTPAVLALQSAQRQLIKTEKYQHPFYWAGFVLTGVSR